MLAAESSRCARWGRSGTVLLVSVAGLEDVIAQWGTEMLDRPMEDLARILRAGCRASDFVTRLDANQFGVLLTETDEIAAINVVERLRAKADRDVGARLSQGRVCFGWASPKGKTTLLESIGAAEALLAQEAAEACRPVRRTGSRSPASIRTGSRFSDGVSGHENFASYTHDG